ncbi:PREDICTED: Golgi membrane protein 1 isoform X1 [Gavialis gangeticus]|uniref:Golgi membrane protein 1 isoform X1 n=1 Tax=Gavialis gangeticus TaxID=94835 RepID=UPI00092F2B13|nr:PREDICTED: Golgi membrane protein 1 isoform X1 [Gavialis gangeticus]XP_019372917.1 PREDICTED: Golgi membrane protein 1 isoform X1 [Gavialis gangeticus]XP_019372918.1 PREDICTED: Golgi membrane protein 1 isoform X1 [Gavialis gangeticus]
MVGLGNGRRGMKSPPLLVAALVACLVVLGFNYWIASSRSIDLQNRIMELEGRVRRAAAERGAVELKKNEFQGELEKQREQIDKIQSLHNFQMENAKKIHQDEKVMLMNNITTNERLIQNLQEHLKVLQMENGKLQLDVYRYQKNQTNLQRKFSYDLTQCANQMKELKEQCEERIGEITKKDSEAPQTKEHKDFTDNSPKNFQVNNQLPAFNQLEVQQNDLEQQKTDEQEKSKIPGSLSGEVPKSTLNVKNALENDSHRNKDGTNDLVTISKQEVKAEGEKLSIDQGLPQDSAKATVDHEELPPEPGKESNPYEEVKNVAENGAEEQESFRVQKLQASQATNEQNIANEEVEREHFLNYDAQLDDQGPSKDDKQGPEAVNQNKGIDYNLDENEAESETDKQAALAGSEHNLHVPNSDQNVKSHLLGQAEEEQQKL